MKPKKINKPQRYLNDLAEEALLSAFRKLVLERRKTGDSLVLWENGRVVHVPASKIPLPDIVARNGKR